MKYDLKGHIRPLLFQNHSTTLVYGSIFMKIYMNAINISNFFNKLYMTANVTFMLWRSFVTFLLLDLLT